MIEEGIDIYKINPKEFEEKDEKLAKKDWTYGIPDEEKKSFKWYYHLKPYVAPGWK